MRTARAGVPSVLHRAGDRCPKTVVTKSCSFTLLATPVMKGAIAGDAAEPSAPQVGEAQASPLAQPVAVAEDDADLWSPRSLHVPSLRTSVREGSLHHQPCTFDEYLNISADFGRYDLVDGILVALPMTDGQHDRAVMYLLTLFGERKRARTFRGTDVATCSSVPNAKLAFPRVTTVYRTYL